MSLFQRRIEKDFEFFVKTLPTLEPIEFCGLAKILSVPMVRQQELNGLTREDYEKMGLEEKTEYVAEFMIPMDEVLEKMMDKYLGLTKRRRREINQILKEIKKSNKNEVRKNGTTA